MVQEERRFRGRLVVSPGGGYCARETNVREWTAVALAAFMRNGERTGREPTKKAAPFRGHPFQRGKVGRSQRRLVWRRVGDVQRQ